MRLDIVTAKKYMVSRTCTCPTAKLVIPPVLTGRVFQMQTVPQIAAPQKNVKASQWILAILLGVCGGLLCLGVDILLHGK